MSDFQQSIGVAAPVAVAGDKASLNPAVYTAIGYLAGDDAVTVGHFVFPEASPVEGDVPKAVSTAASGAPLGFLERNLSYANYDFRSLGTMTVPKYANLNIAVKGDFYAVSSTAATAGQKVFATLADGSIQTGAAGASISGAVETSFSVITGGDAGENIIISNWS
jgi:hypothetical protein